MFFYWGKGLIKPSPPKQIMAEKRGQIGMELMVIVGLMMLFMLPMISLLLAKTGEFNEKAAIAKVSEDAGRIAGTADNVGRMGPGSKVTLQIDTPGGVSDVKANDAGELSFTMETRFGPTDIVRMSSFKLSIETDLKNALKQPGTHMVTVDYPYDTLNNRIILKGQ
jgi:hypothetical protein